MTEQALEDLGAICVYIARDAPLYARVFATRAFEMTDRVGRYPLSGRAVPEVGREDIREVILGNYRIIYRVLRDEVEVLTVHHGARRLDTFKPPAGGSG